jgi:hypothetical protein
MHVRVLAVTQPVEIYRGHTQVLHLRRGRAEREDIAGGKGEEKAKAYKAAVVAARAEVTALRNTQTNRTDMPVMAGA